MIEFLCVLNSRNPTLYAGLNSIYPIILWPGCKQVSHPHLLIRFLADLLARHAAISRLTRF